MQKIAIVLTCAGAGTRAGFNENKLLYKTGGKTVAEKTFDAFFSTGLFSEFVVTSSKEDLTAFTQLFKDKAKIVLGGSTRSQSVRNALKEVESEIVLIHDGARPFVDREIIENCIETVRKFGSAITAIPSVNTVCNAKNGEITAIVGKNNVYDIQTPQGFYTKDIVKAYSCSDEDFPDESSVYLKFIGTPHLSKGNAKNVKLTLKEDFDFDKNIRTGEGFDCHRLVENRKLILGGITVPFDKGLLGHSDADVLTHAVMDSVLSACGLRDIGYYFPDTDDKYLNANSIELLEKVLDLAHGKGYTVKSVSAVIMAEKPKLSPFIEEIKRNLCSVLDIKTDDFGLSATTLEGLGFVGREEGICVHASCVVKEL